MKKSQIIVKMINKGESEIVEFKNNFDNETIETLVSFANTKGGKIFIGVTDGGQTTGVKIGNETIQQWINEIKTKTQPSLIPDIEIIELFGKHVAVFDIQEYPVKPVSFKGRYYKRIKNSNHLISIEEVVNLHLKTFNTSWDYYIDTTHSIKDISLEKVNKFIDLTNKNRDVKIVDDPLSVLRKFELLRGDGISQACFLLFMKDISLLSGIEIGRFQTETLIKDGLRIKTDLFTEVEQGLNFIKKHINKKYIITGDAQREERWEYPLDAIREIVINAIVHRDYSKPSDSLIKIFDDRIEFYNPGKLSEGLTVKKLIEGNYISSIRNKQIADVFKESGIIEKYGSGIKRILKSFNISGLKMPQFKEEGEGFLVTVYNTTTQKTTQKNTQKTTQKKNIKHKIIDVIKKDKFATRSSIAETLQISPNTVKEYLAKLKKEMKIKRTGGDKGGFWEIIETN